MRAVGSAVSTVTPGDTVVVHPIATCGRRRACRAGDDAHCANLRFPANDSDGGMAELLLTNVRSLVKLDPSLRPADVAALADAGVHIVFDFVGEKGTEAEGLAMLSRAGSYCVIGYGGRVDIPIIDIISTAINVIGNLVGWYNDLAELVTLAARGKGSLHTKNYPLDAVNEAMDDLDSGRLQGRGILVLERS